MRIRALAGRILNQLRHDKRTLAMMLIAPLLVLTLVYFILEGSDTRLNIGVINAPGDYIESLKEQDVNVIRCAEANAREAIETGSIEASVDIQSGKLYIELDGSNSTKAKAVLAAIQTANSKVNSARPDLIPEIYYVYGYEDLSTFDNFGSVLIGFIIFFFVFLIAGISFLQERTTGTLEKLLSTPIRRWEIVAGYVLGFGLSTVLQSVIISTFVVYVLGVMMIGSFYLVLLITVLTAIAALTLGILLSTAANNEFQMIQFIPVVIIPQVFFSGLFELSPVMDAIGRFMPLYYVADALNQVMIKGGGLGDILLDLAVILGCCFIFMIANTLMLKKHRRI